MGYADFDWGGNVIDGRSTIGGCFSLGSSMVSWMSKNKDIVALSSIEVEYVVASGLLGSSFVEEVIVIFISRTV